MEAKHTPRKWWGIFDAKGNLRATCDSESEAYFNVHVRGYIYNGSYRRLPIRSDAAPKLLEALELIESGKTRNGLVLTAGDMRSIARMAIQRIEDTQHG
jgi:hypothetical protein